MKRMTDEEVLSKMDEMSRILTATAHLIEARKEDRAVVHGLVLEGKKKEARSLSRNITLDIDHLFGSLLRNMAVYYPELKSAIQKIEPRHLLDFKFSSEKSIKEVRQ